MITCLIVAVKPSEHYIFRGRVVSDSKAIDSNQHFGVKFTGLLHNYHIKKLKLHPVLKLGRLNYAFGVWQQLKP